MMTETRKPTALIILDGWGHRDPAEDNAISNAQTPFWDKLWQNQPKTLINTSGMFVGLPQGQMGNSEVGHMNLGAGRVVYQSLTRIDKDLEDGKFQSNEALCNAIDKAVANGKAVHIMGLLSPGGVHSHEDHMLAAAELAAARGAKEVYIHKSEEHTSELQSRPHLVCRLLLEKKKKKKQRRHDHTKKK